MEQHIKKIIRLTIPQDSPAGQNYEAAVLLTKSENLLTATVFPVEFSKFLTTGN